MTEQVRARLWRWLLAPRDAAALAVFRILFGLLVSISAIRFLAYGWVDDLLARPTFHFKYWGLAWVPALPAPYLHLVFGLLVLLGLAVSAGLFYRPAIVLLFLAFSYVQLVDVTNYLNHYYLVSLLAGLLCFIPAHAAWSLDTLRRPALRREALPAWCTILLRFQVAVVYVFAGLAKMTGDWLLHAQPLNIWLSARTGTPLAGPWLDQRWAAYAASWGGFLFDTTVVAFLLMRRTRPWAYLVLVGFHATTQALFPIGMFPAIMTTAALVFFDPSWPRTLWARLRRRPPAAAPAPAPAVVLAPVPVSRGARVALAAAAAYGVLQIAVPLRAHLYGGNVLWHEQGMRFSWRVMAREKNGAVDFLVRDPRSGREWMVSPRRYLSQLQEQEMSVQPDLILQLAHRIARDWAARAGGPVEVRADARVSLNGRPPERFLDPDVDLARVSDGLGAKPWILPAPETPPIHLRPVLARHR